MADETLRIYVENSRERDPAYRITEEAVRRALSPVALPAIIDVRYGDERDERAIRAAHVFVAGRLDMGMLSAWGERLRIVHCTSAGVESYMPLDWLPPGAVLTNSSGVHAAKAGEFGLLAVLMLHQGIPAYATLQRQHRWQRSLSSTIAGRKVLLYGVGALGGAVAERLRPLGLDIVGVRRSGEPHPAVGRTIRPDRLADELADTDFLILACPLTPETKGAIGRAELAALKPGASVVNMARAAVMDYDALAGLLAEGHLSGAILDVFDREPLPETSPLWDVPNLFITPHISADDPHGYVDRCLAILAENLARQADGLPLRNVVDGRRGY
ncbi:D-2-hydroxyacid dehydrogenase [Pseudochelatococcus lubricantis]|uniref:D-2-hydroxyacid dehydrogenase n=1 Tax=Pseudochelatococcus lubricantis TaxID=1538102 RepID=UPI0035E9BDFC